MSIEVSITDNSKKVLSEFEEKVSLALDSIGQTAEGHAKSDCPVDTGRLRNSITFATKTAQGSPNTSGGEAASPEDYQPKATPEKNTVYIGSNVEYAAPVEFRDAHHKTGKAHFLKGAIANHNAEYKEITEKALKD